MKFSKYISKAVTPVMALFQKQNRLLFKHGYDNLRSFRTEFVEDAGTAHRRGDNVPSDNMCWVSCVKTVYQ